MNNQNSRGAALISALFIMTLIAIVVVSMSSRLQIDTYRTRLIIQSDKHYLASQAVRFWAMGSLASSTKLKSFPSKFQNLYPAVKLSGKIYDLQSRFNLNNLTNKYYLPIFLNLLDRLLPDISPKERNAIAVATQLWINPYSTGRGQDDLMKYYLKQKPPYYAAYQLFQSVSEFRLVRGISAKIYMKLEPYITALPETTAINLNTVSKPLLLSLSSSISEEQADEFFKTREENGSLTQNDLVDFLNKTNIRSEQIALDSTYFKVVAHVDSDDLKFKVNSILKRTLTPNRKVEMSLIEEELNN